MGENGVIQLPSCRCRISCLCHYPPDLKTVLIFTCFHQVSCRCPAGYRSFCYIYFRQPWRPCHQGDTWNLLTQNDERRFRSYTSKSKRERCFTYWREPRYLFLLQATFRFKTMYVHYCKQPHTHTWEDNVWTPEWWSSSYFFRGR